jgi:peptide/nickel transport system ATP-binding protein/oligopeptide transport system ATP-binding protein
MNNRELLTVRGLKKYFAIGGGFLRGKPIFLKAVDGVDITVKRGETFGLVGESGCGKTTLGRCILRLEDPTEGRIFFEDQDILAYDRHQLQAARKNMQVIFQDPYSSLNPRKKVSRIIGESFSVHKSLSKREGRERVNELANLVGIRPEQIDRYPHEFSGGQRQRICIARALALNPKLIVADEPVSALDVSIQAQILNLLVELQNQFSLTYLFISHDLSVVRHICDRVAVMYTGRIVELADTVDLFRHPLHPYTQALLSAVPTTKPIRPNKRIRLQGEVPSQITPPSGCTFHPRCAKSKEECRLKRPGLIESRQNHWVACHF